MTLMDGERRIVSDLERQNYTHVKVWGVLDLEKGEAKIRATCRRCGDYGEFDTRQQANAFKAHHQGANNQCPHERDEKY